MGHLHVQCLTAIARPRQASTLVSAQAEDGRRYARRLLNEVHRQLARQNAESMPLRAVTQEWFNNNAISAESSSNVTQRTDRPRADAHDPLMRLIHVLRLASVNKHADDAHVFSRLKFGLIMIDPPSRSFLFRFVQEFS